MQSILVKNTGDVSRKMKGVNFNDRRNLNDFDRQNIYLTPGGKHLYFIDSNQDIFRKLSASFISWKVSLPFITKYNDTKI